ncbi:MAG: CrcB family protein [Phycisphaerales bacterium]|nr:CrcB family protein [Phycisphaerales bacterium]
MWRECLIVGGFGGAGAIVRFVLSTWVNTRFPTQLGGGTLAVNVAGCLLGGVILALLETHRPINDSLRLALMIGFLGGLTTFSAFGCEVFQLIHDQRPMAAAGLTVANVLLGLVAVSVGFLLVRWAS